MVKHKSVSIYFLGSICSRGQFHKGAQGWGRNHFSVCKGAGLLFTRHTLAFFSIPSAVSFDRLVLSQKQEKAGIRREFGCFVKAYLNPTGLQSRAVTPALVRLLLKHWSFLALLSSLPRLTAHSWHLSSWTLALPCCLKMKQRHEVARGTRGPACWWG